MCWHVYLEGADTWDGADTSRCWHADTFRCRQCRHLWYQSHELCLDTGMCWQMPAPGKVPTPRKVLACVNTSRCWHRCRHTCRHVLTYECYLEARMCWHVSAPRRCRHLSRCWHVPTRLGADTCRHLKVPTRADTCDISHMNFTWILGCAGKCQHLERCLHLERCRHMLACVNTSRCRHRCRHIYVPTRDVLTYKCYLEAGMCWHMISIRDVGTCRHLDVPARVGTFPHQVSALFQVLTHASTSQFANEKVHMISMTDVGTCRHLDVSAHSQVSALFQVLTHVSTYQHPNKKVHMISIRDVGT